MTRFALAAAALLSTLAPEGAAARGVCAATPPDVALSFVGVALDGPAEPSSGQLLSPARFRVERWTQGDGPDEVEVETAVQVEGELVQFNSVGITPRTGERWRIRGNRSPAGVVETSICTGSELVSGSEVDSEPPADPRVTDEPPPGPGDDRLLSLGVSAAGAVALAVALTKKPG